MLASAEERALALLNTTSEFVHYEHSDKLYIVNPEPSLEST